MLEVETQVNKGIMFIRLGGSLDNSTFITLSKKINYLLYEQGIHYYVFNFEEVYNLDGNIFLKLQNKLIEIFLSCGKVVMCGLNELFKKKIGSTRDNLFYVNREIEAFKYLNL